jgi:hypothetical protein
LAGVTVGTTTSAVAYIASVKSRIANLLMRSSWQPKIKPALVQRGCRLNLTLGADETPAGRSEKFQKKFAGPIGMVAPGEQPLRNGSPEKRAGRD